MRLQWIHIKQDFHNDLTNNLISARKPLYGAKTIENPFTETANILGAGIDALVCGTERNIFFDSSRYDRGKKSRFVWNSEDGGKTLFQTG